MSTLVESMLDERASERVIFRPSNLAHVSWLKAIPMLASSPLVGTATWFRMSSPAFSPFENYHIISAS